MVALDWHWWGGGPRDFFGSDLIQPLTSLDQAKRDFTFLHILDRKHAMKMDAGDGKRPTSVDFVVWCCSDHVLELQADTSFAKTGVMNALARELALSAARTYLLDFLKDRLDDGKSYTPKGADDPAVIQFVARFKANFNTLMEEASSAPAAFSMSHSLLPHDVEDQLRGEVARNRRTRADWEEHKKSCTEYNAAIQAYISAAVPGASVFPAPAGIIPKKQKAGFTHGREPSSPDPLAAWPPLVLRPMEDLYRVFTDAEMMVVFSKVILSTGDYCLCPEYKIWFEKKRAVKNEYGAVRHEYGYKTGEPFG